MNKGNIQKKESLRATMVLLDKINKIIEFYNTNTSLFIRIDSFDREQELVTYMYTNKITLPEYDYMKHRTEWGAEAFLNYILGFVAGSPLGTKYVVDYKVRDKSGNIEHLTYDAFDTPEQQTLTEKKYVLFKYALAKVGINVIYDIR